MLARKMRVIEDTMSQAQPDKLQCWLTTESARQASESSERAAQFEQRLRQAMRWLTAAPAVAPIYSQPNNNKPRLIKAKTQGV